MRSKFVGLIAVVLAMFCSAQLVAAQDATKVNPAVAKAQAARAKQMEDAGKGVKRAVDAEAKLKTDAQALAPTLIASQKIPCTMTDARNALAYEKVVTIELACQEGLGYLITANTDGSNAAAFDCVNSPTTPVPGGPCALPANASPAKGLQPFMARAGSDCVVNNANRLAQNPTTAVYEVACASGVGEILSVTLPRTATSRAISQPCLFLSAMAKIDCTLTTAEANAAPVKALAAKANRPCTVNNQRYLSAAADGSDFYEFACTDGSGFVVQADPKGVYMRSLSCVQATSIGAGCTLTDTKAAIAQQNTVFSNIAKAAGFDCTVDKFRDAYQPKAGSGVNQIVELGCSNRPDSVFALVNPAGDKGEIFHCARARVEGYVCTYSTTEQAYASLTQNLREAGRSAECVVNGQRPMGASTKNAFIEVTCADGNLGFVISYPLGKAKPEEAIVCSQAGGLGGGCTLPGNKKT